MIQLCFDSNWKSVLTCTKKELDQILSKMVQFRLTCLIKSSKTKFYSFYLWRLNFLLIVDEFNHKHSKNYHKDLSYYSQDLRLHWGICDHFEKFFNKRENLKKVDEFIKYSTNIQLVKESLVKLIKLYIFTVKSDANNIYILIWHITSIS